MPNDNNEQSKGALVPAENAAKDQSPPPDHILHQLIEIEQERIRSQDRRTEVAMRAIEASDASDKRQYEYHVQRLESEERRATARMSLGGKVVLGVSSVLAAILGVTFYMLFFGSPDQSDYAEEILKGLFAVVGGGGLFYLVQRGLQWIMKNR